jgi:hypothetical protein
VVNANLHAALTIKQQARELAARSAAAPDEAHEITGAYERLRERAQDLNARAWPENQTFDRDVPPLTSTASLRRLPRGMSGAQPLVDAVASGQRASILAGQLAAWAQGHQEAFELEARLEVEAEAKEGLPKKLSLRWALGVRCRAATPLLLRPHAIGSSQRHAQIEARPLGRLCASSGSPTP